MLEAMASGCPTIITPEVGLAKTIKETKTGIVTNGEPNLIGQAINDLLADEQKRNKMGSQGREVARKSFSWKSVAEQILSSYKNIIYP